MLPLLHRTPSFTLPSDRGALAGDDDLKGVVMFLASDAACYVTGASISVDAGYTAK